MEHLCRLCDPKGEPGFEHVVTVLVLPGGLHKARVDDQNGHAVQDVKVVVCLLEGVMTQGRRLIPGIFLVALALDLCPK
jgi:hypothetical protein